MQMKVITIGGFSGHSDRGQLLRYMKKVIPKPQRVLVQHGDYSKCENLSNSIGRMLRMRATAPQNLETIRLM
jgi:predicted metal-dependent RNase